jgi:hypothetical protein
MISTLFKDFFLGKNLVPMGIFQSNHHLLIIDGHGSHVSLEAIKHAQEFGLNMFTLFNHTFHTLQPLDVSCFKPFKTMLKKKWDGAMTKNNYLEPNKITLASWVDKVG